MFLLDQKAKRYGQRPSSLLPINLDGEPLLANSIDNAAYLWGVHIEGLLGQTDDKGRPKHSLAELLAPDQPKTRGRYRSIGRTKDL